MSMAYVKEMVPQTPLLWTREQASDLDRAIHHTVRYFDLFEQPVTATQIWRYLIISTDGLGVRWAGHRAYHLRDIITALAQSLYLQQHVASRYGYFFLRGKDLLVPERLRRHRLAQDKWRLTQAVAKWLVYVPFVRMIAMSGSLAVGNTGPTSDLDLFVIVRSGRIWTARLGLLILTHLSGRRRKYWDIKAPDKICLNHYLADNALAIAPEIRNVYTAVLYQTAIPLFGLDVFEHFQRINATWTKRFLMIGDVPSVPSVLALKPWRSLLWFRARVESILLEPLGAIIERAAERVQRRAIMRHTRPQQGGRVVLNERELAFHPDSKVPGLLNRFAQDAGQQALL